MPRTIIALSPPGTLEAFVEDLVIAAAYRRARTTTFNTVQTAATLSFLFLLPDTVWTTWNVRLGGAVGISVGGLS